jgi:hypothetical protein
MAKSLPLEYNYRLQPKHEARPKKISGKHSSLFRRQWCRRSVKYIISTRKVFRSQYFVLPSCPINSFRKKKLLLVINCLHFYKKNNQWGSVTHQMAVPVPSISCCVLNHHNLFYQIHNALAFNWEMCCHLALVYGCFLSILIVLV